MKNIIIALAEELANTLETYKKYDVEFMYWETQYNFPVDETMRERALRHKNGLREEAEAERKRAVDAFYEKYEGTEYEDEANMVDVISAMRKAHSEACKAAEQMRRANGIFIE